MIIESAFVASSGKLALRTSVKRHVVCDDCTSVDIPAINDAARSRAELFVSRLLADQPRVIGRSVFAREYNAERDDSRKDRLCVAHDQILNKLTDGWSLQYPLASDVLSDARAGDILITTDHKSGYHAIPIRADQRKYFCFRHPVSGLVYRCKRLDFGWLLAPGVFCYFSAHD